MYKTTIFFLLTLFTTSFISAEYRWLNDFYNATEETARLEVGYYTGDYISIDEDYTEFAVFAPLKYCFNDLRPFIDARNYVFNNGKWGSSLGWGVRDRLCCCDAAVGINSYFDYRRGNTKHSYNQWGVGLEYLSCDVDLRLNTYWVFENNRHHSNRTRVVTEGSTVVTERLIEFAYSGFDAEVGKKLFSIWDIDLYAGLGPYYFTRSHLEQFWGGFGRFEANYKDFLSLQVRVSHDDHNSTRVQGLIELSLPLYYLCPCGVVENTCVDWLLDQPVRRNGVILTDHKWR